MQGAGFMNFNRLTIKRDFQSLEVDLETLHILSTLSKPRLVGPYASGLQDVTLGARVDISSIFLIRETIRSLNLRISLRVWSMADKAVELMQCILGIFSSGHFCELKLFSLLAIWDYSGRRALSKLRTPEAQNLRTQIREFEESIRYLCQSAGIECSLDLYIFPEFMY